MRLEEMNELAIEVLFESARIEIEDKPFIVLPDVETEGRKFKHGAMRIKISNTGKTRDTSLTSSFPIDTSKHFPSIMEDKVVYGDKLKNSDKRKQLDAARAVVRYAFNELETIYKNPSTKNIEALKNKLEEFNELGKAEKKSYIALGSD